MAKIPKTPGPPSWAGKIVSMSFDVRPTPEWEAWAREIMARTVIRVEVGSRAFEFDAMEAKELEDGRWTVALSGGREVSEGGPAAGRGEAGE